MNSYPTSLMSCLFGVLLSNQDAIFGLIAMSERRVATAKMDLEYFLTVLNTVNLHAHQTQGHIWAPQETLSNIKFKQIMLEKWESRVALSLLSALSYKCAEGCRIRKVGQPKADGYQSSCAVRMWFLSEAVHSYGLHICASWTSFSLNHIILSTESK